MPSQTNDAIVLRSHAGGHLVYCGSLNSDLMCLPLGRLKKEKVSIITGDRVEIAQIDFGQRTGVIRARKNRHNQLTRPVIANIDTPVVVQAAHQPEWNPLLCDRYLVHVQLELPGITPILCVNKSDLSRSREQDDIRRIYEPLGYKLLFVSAGTGQGIDDLASALHDKTAVLIGPSGAGKSSIINSLDPGLQLRTGIMTNKFGVGRSTTTYSALYPVKSNRLHKSGWVADTPGFSLPELRHGQPSELTNEFVEILKLSTDCRYANCLHINEQGCNVLEHMHEIAPSRHHSYSIMAAESLKQYELTRSTSRKQED